VSAGVDRLPARTRFGYGIGDFGFNLFFTTASLYLIFYYTDVLGLAPDTAGWVFAIALMWDALFDPFMGYLANRTRTRWGRYRPYLLLGGIPLAFSWALMFLPVPLEGAPLLLFAVATHILFRTLYAVVGMPYLALSATMTRDAHERGVLASIRMVAATSCGLFVAFSTLKFVALFGGGREGFFWTAVLYGGLASIVFLAVFATAREEAPSTDEHHPTMREMVLMLRHNRAFWIVCAAMLAGAFGSTMFSKTLPYYCKYVLGREDMIPLALTALTAAIAFSMPIWTAVMKRSSKRVMWMCGASLAVCGFGGLLLLPPSTGLFLPLIGLIGLGIGATYLGFWSMMPDTVEYGQFTSGIRSEGAVFGFVSLIQKGALGLAAAALGELLANVGYRANQQQSAETLDALRLIMLVGGGSMILVGIGIIAFYPLNSSLHGRLRRAIAWRERPARSGQAAL
jgi:GPH family glycoside/pentoside/hexuronide:cation symporter